MKSYKNLKDKDKQIWSWYTLFLEREVYKLCKRNIVSFMKLVIKVLESMVKLISIYFYNKMFNVMIHIEFFLYQIPIIYLNNWQVLFKRGKTPSRMKAAKREWKRFPSSVDTQRNVTQLSERQEKREKQEKLRQENGK